ncbi:tripartite tricarboxylate transporter TctB family protein [Pontibaca salina]|uniref:Tripartite tricarboxylate transporter TctB family protein n=1 Tax=Pontibaca salina TaxID=2795731 RepID=A0A934LZ79_9RHOB|nr:tripartite tricarboxylate transporter TctB family protein [Pontibaca salina]MBI6630612.1 tripartite tricarboxylate transporter TctB family protein [Pontibaca salina]
MRLAEIITAGVMALLSIYLMWKSTELNVGYITGEGPGGGAWPFWLSGIMLICTVMIAINWFRRTSPPSRSKEVLLDGYGRRTLVLVGGGLLGFIALVNIISMYGAMLVFLVYYLRFLGRHSWTLTGILSISLPVTFFLFFEAVMRITLPKGMQFTEPFYNYLNTIIY